MSARLILKLSVIVIFGWVAHALHRPLQPLSEGVKHLTKSGIGIMLGLPGVWLLSDELPQHDTRLHSVLNTLVAYAAMGLGVFFGWVTDAVREEKENEQ
jgi:hypothetical protein